MTDEAKDHSGEPTACFPGDLSKISTPVILKKEQAATTESESTTPPPAPEEDVIVQIERLEALKEQGLLTEEEFAAQKAELLGM